jgi:hypothetical protein
MKNLKEAKNGFELNGMFIPKDPSNTDYQKIQEWIKSGGEYEKFDYLQETKDNKIVELNNFHASEEVKIFTIKLANGATTKISVDADTRYLLDEQISLLNFKKMQGEADPKWMYQNGIDMPLNLTALIGIRLYIGALVDANFKAKKIHEKAIENLKNEAEKKAKELVKDAEEILKKAIKEIEKYDFKIGYRLNQILSF